MGILNSPVVAVVGLGYVGLPLALEFGKIFKTIGFDISAEKLRAYRSGVDPTGELSCSEFLAAKYIYFSDDQAVLNEADFIIVAVPTPITPAKTPDFSPLISASEAVGSNMKTGAIVIFESTVYPGATEEICIPILERESGLTWRSDFSVGYSPERVNPGDRQHNISSVVKVVSGDTPKTLDAIAYLYGRVVQAGIYKASSIKVAEAAKVIENTQRDLNIALMNELSVIFKKIGIDTQEVLDAASTKWNFIPFKPGLVGGHCIGVDPYYLTYKAQSLNYHPHVILAGRHINDSMPSFIAQQIAKELSRSSCQSRNKRVAVLGVTFKENCADVRNSKVFDLILELKEYGFDVEVTDPLADPLTTQLEYGIELKPINSIHNADALILAVPHQQYRSMPVDQLLVSLAADGIVFDVKSALESRDVTSLGIRLWRL